MGRLQGALARVGGLFHRARRDSDLAEELQCHLQMHIDDNLRAGMTPVEARRRALVGLGGVELVKERCRDQRGLPLLEHLAQDLRHGLRRLAATPAFTAIAVLTLAAGIGANTAVFSLWNQALLEPLPVANPQELVQVVLTSQGSTYNNLSYPEFRFFGENRQVFSNALLYSYREANLRHNGQWERVNAQLVSGSFYSTLGVNAVLGRTITEHDEGTAAPVAVLSYSFWKRRFGQQATVLGKTVELNGAQYLIVGVTPSGFYGVNRLSPPDITVPMTAAAPPGMVWCVGRLRPGVLRAQARAALAAPLADALQQQKPLIKDWPQVDQERWLGVKADLLPAGTGNWGLELMLADPLPLLTAAFGILLLIGCVNVANLLLARAGARTAEISTRLALGATRGRIFQQLLTETLLLSFIGGALGLLMAVPVHRLFVRLLPIGPDATVGFGVDSRILAFTAAVSLLSGMLFGTLPALRVARVDPYTALKGATAGGDRRRLRPTRALLVVQVAASVVLLAGAALLVRTLRNLQTLDAGFDRDHLLMLTVDPRQARYRGPQVVALYDQLFARLQALPGLRSGALARNSLFGEGYVQKTVWVNGYNYAPRENHMVAFNEVGPNFFATAGIPLLMGRDFEARDRAGALPVAVVNEAFARKYFPGLNPIGRRFGDESATATGKYEIIGVTKDAKYWTLPEGPRPAVFHALWQVAGDFPIVLHVRTDGAPAGIAGQITQMIRSTDRDLVVYDTRTMAQQVSLTLRHQQAMALLSTLIGALALLLTCVGLYGVAGYSVTRRTHEIGTRMALGAQPGDILRMILRETVVVALAGVAIGIPVALAASRLLASLLYGLTARDPAAMLMAAALMIAVAAVAAYLPARRAARVVPMTALRYE